MILKLSYFLSIHFGKATCKSFLQPLPFQIGRALSYKDDGNEEFKKGNYKKAIKVYTEGIKVNCSDMVVMSTLYANRANAHFKIGKIQSCSQSFLLS